VLLLSLFSVSLAEQAFVGYLAYALWGGWAAAAVTLARVGFLCVCNHATKDSP
jgi:hypothetical protein